MEKKKKEDKYYLPRDISFNASSRSECAALSSHSATRL